MLTHAKFVGVFLLVCECLHSLFGFFFLLNSLTEPKQLSGFIGHVEKSLEVLQAELKVSEGEVGSDTKCSAGVSESACSPPTETNWRVEREELQAKHTEIVADLQSKLDQEAKKVSLLKEQLDAAGGAAGGGGRSGSTEPQQEQPRNGISTANTAENDGTTGTTTTAAVVPDASLSCGDADSVVAVATAASDTQTALVELQAELTNMQVCVLVPPRTHM
jgi:hypothetical protein